MQTLSRIPFTTVKTEGGILPADLLSRVAASKVAGLLPPDYHLAPSERLNEAISRSWNRLLGVWRSFDDQRRVLPEADRGTTLTRERWPLILFQELGYGRLTFAGKLAVEDGQGDSQTYPISHVWEQTPIHLVSFRQELDRRDPAVGRSPHSLLQEFLNRWDASLWAFAVDNSVRRPVDYRNLDTEELGSVYESRLELHPQLNVDAATFTLDVVAGSERKTTGTHYTPTSLVNSLLDTALEPVIAERLAQAKGTQGDKETRARQRRPLVYPFPPCLLVY
jgi:hypothetical protein